jgi:hypothetical protein
VPLLNLLAGFPLKGFDPSRWLLGREPKRRLLIGEIGWSVPSAEAVRSTGGERDEAAPRVKYSPDAAPRQPLGWGRNAHDAECADCRPIAVMGG